MYIEFIIICNTKFYEIFTTFLWVLFKCKREYNYITDLTTLVSHTYKWNRWILIDLKINSRLSWTQIFIFNKNSWYYTSFNTFFFFISICSDTKYETFSSAVERIQQNTINISAKQKHFNYWQMPIVLC